MSSNLMDDLSKKYEFVARFREALESLKKAENQARMESDSVFRKERLNALRDMIGKGIPGKSEEEESDRKVFTDIIDNAESEYAQPQAGQTATKSTNAEPAQIRMETITQKLIRLLQEARQRYYDRLEERNAKKVAPANEAPEVSTTSSSSTERNPEAVPNIQQQEATPPNPAETNSEAPENVQQQESQTASPPKALETTREVPNIWQEITSNQQTIPSVSPSIPKLNPNQLNRERYIPNDHQATRKKYSPERLAKVLKEDDRREMRLKHFHQAMDDLSECFKGNPELKTKFDKLPGKGREISWRLDRQMNHESDLPWIQAGVMNFIKDNEAKIKEWLKQVPPEQAKALGDRINYLDNYMDAVIADREARTLQVYRELAAMPANAKEREFLNEYAPTKNMDAEHVNMMQEPPLPATPDLWEDSVGVASENVYEFQYAPKERSRDDQIRDLRNDRQQEKEIKHFDEALDELSKCFSSNIELQAQFDELAYHDKQTAKWIPNQDYRSAQLPRKQKEFINFIKGNESKINRWLMQIPNEQMKVLQDRIEYLGKYLDACVGAREARYFQALREYAPWLPTDEGTPVPPFKPTRMISDEQMKMANDPPVPPSAELQQMIVESQEAKVNNLDDLIKILEKNASKWPATLREVKEAKNRVAEGKMTDSDVARVLEEYRPYTNNPNKAKPSEKAPGLCDRFESIVKLCKDPTLITDYSPSQKNKLGDFARQLEMLKEGLANGAFPSTTMRFDDFKQLAGPVRQMLESAQQRAQRDGKPMNPAQEKLLEKIKDCDAAFERRIAFNKSLEEPQKQEPAKPDVKEVKEKQDTTPQQDESSSARP